MAEDREVLREVWSGRVPACFSLAPSDVSTLTAPDSYYLMLPRHSYLPIVTDKVRKHFSRFVAAELQENPLWFSCDGVALRWHMPIGVIFDLQQTGAADSDDGGVALPWQITVHFDKYPDKEILFCDSTDVVEGLFMNSVKEADQLKHAGKVVSAMQKKDHHQLWQGLYNDKFDQFWAVNRRLMEVAPGEETFKHLPLRLFEKDQALPQKLYRTLGADKQRLLLQDLLIEAFPERNTERAKVMTQGIEVPQDTPLQWMSEHLSYPDNFLYLSVKIE